MVKLFLEMGALPRGAWILRTLLTLPRPYTLPTEPNPFAVVGNHPFSPGPRSPNVALFVTRRAALRSAWHYFAPRERAVLLYDLGAVQRACAQVVAWRPAVRVAHVADDVVLAELARCGAVLLASSALEAQRGRAAGALDVVLNPGQFAPPSEVAFAAGRTPPLVDLGPPEADFTVNLERAAQRPPPGARFLLAHGPGLPPSAAAAASAHFPGLELLHVQSEGFLRDAAVFLAQVVGRRVAAQGVCYYLNGAPRTEHAPRGFFLGTPPPQPGQDVWFYGPERHACWKVAGGAEALNVHDWVLFESLSAQPPEPPFVTAHFRTCSAV